MGFLIKITNWSNKSISYLLGTINVKYAQWQLHQNVRLCLKYGNFLFSTDTFIDSTKIPRQTSSCHIVLVILKFKYVKVLNIMNLTLEAKYTKLYRFITDWEIWKDNKRKNYLLSHHTVVTACNVLIYISFDFKKHMCMGTYAFFMKWEPTVVTSF